MNRKAAVLSARIMLLILSLFISGTIFSEEVLGNGPRQDNGRAVGNSSRGTVRSDNLFTAIKITEVARYERSTESIERMDDNVDCISRDNTSHRAISRGNSDYFNTLNTRIFKITAYTAGPESTGKRPGDAGYGITATGTTVKEHHTIAADWRVLPPGTRVLIEGLDDVYVVEDCGGAVKGNQIDLYIPELQDALDWGVQHRKVIVLQMGERSGQGKITH